MGSTEVCSLSDAMFQVGGDVLVTLYALVIEINVPYTPMFLQWCVDC